MNKEQFIWIIVLTLLFILNLIAYFRRSDNKVSHFNLFAAGFVLAVIISTIMRIAWN